MKIENKIIIAVFCVCVGLVLLLKQNTNNDAYYYKDFNNVTVLPINFVFTSYRQYNTHPDEPILDTIEDLEESSDLIIKARLIDYEQFAQEATRAEVDVIDVYKGDVKKGDKIKYLELITIHPGSKTIITNSMYYPMRDKEEYIIYLKESNADGYYEYTSRYVSRYNVNKDKIHVFEGDSFSSEIIYDVVYWDKESAIATIPQEKANYERYYEKLIRDRETIGNQVYEKYGKEE